MKRIKLFCSIQIFNKASVIHKFHYGFADIKNQIKADDNTTYNAFSVTKTFTSLAILQLAEKGMLNIEHSVIQCMPDFPYSDEITIRQLMTHSAGVPNPIPLSWIHLVKEHKSFVRNNFFGPIFNKHNKTKSKPNEKYAYSNLGYVLLGQIIEKVSGLNYEDYIRVNVLKPLDIDENELDFKITDNKMHAKGYHKKSSFTSFILGSFINKSKYIDETEGKWKAWKNFNVNGASYGGLIGKPDGFLKYIQELLKPNCRLISDEYKELLFKENHTNSNKATGMCLSWFPGRLNHQEYFAHAGDGGGYYCEIRIYRKLGIGSLIMFNRTGMIDERFLDRLDIHYIDAKKPE
ncbi:MAG: hypothetical protein AMS23_04135 [Bacteroides sp. SM1_62]|nr:MAG: hypothetical protein AMS26_11580 [Bacteroides sp. SM23_62]KPL25894.1 MAG: hypothetical protein AMS23_04135 [Bacteroides sp. SM1_62]